MDYKMIGARRSATVVINDDWALQNQFVRAVVRRWYF